MTIITVDDEKLLLIRLQKNIQALRPDYNVLGFGNPAEAIKYSRSHAHEIYAAFLDIEMFGMNGIELAKKLIQICPEINIVFTTGYSEYALQAFGVRACGYLLKPISKEKIKKELNSMELRNPPKAADDRILVKTFGNFEVFYNGMPVRFSRSKSKELFAYLIDRRGASATVSELASVLWEEKNDDDSLQSYLRNLISELRKTLAEIDKESIIIKSRNSISVDVSAIKCDYYDFLDGVPEAIRQFNGEYMSAYSWAEYTTANLTNTEDK